MENQSDKEKTYKYFPITGEIVDGLNDSEQYSAINSNNVILVRSGNSIRYSFDKGEKSFTHILLPIPVDKREPDGWIFEGSFYKTADEFRGFTMHGENYPKPVYFSPQETEVKDAVIKKDKFEKSMEESMKFAEHSDRHAFLILKNILAEYRKHVPTPSSMEDKKEI